MDKDQEKHDPQKNTVNKNGILRPDFLFSYWVVVWFIIYYFASKATKSTGSRFVYENMNPTIALYFALVENIMNLVALMIYEPSLSLFFKFVLMIFVVKIFPIYILRNSKIKLFENVLSLIVIFILYNLYLLYENTNIIEVYTKAFYLVLENKSPFIQIINYISSYV